MACPFRSLMRGSSRTSDQKEAAQASACPYASAFISKQQDAAQQESSSASLSGEETAQEVGEPAITCPLGFSSSKGPKLSRLHCPLCKSLLFEACKTTECQHIFCSFCIARFRDCPLCGRDIDGTEPDSELQGLVDQFLATHIHSPDLVVQVAQMDLGQLPDSSPASFWLMLGLKSFAGGNIPAALDRLQHSKDLLLQAAGLQRQQQQQQQEPVGVDLPKQSQQQEDGEAATAAAAAEAPAAATIAEEIEEIGVSMTGQAPAAAAAGSSHERHQQQQQELTAELACRLGAVCGSQADCLQRLGQVEPAQQLYAESIGYLEPFAEQDKEVWHALCVSINKAGDLHFLQQQWQEAKGMYEKALGKRLGMWERARQQMGAGEGELGQQKEKAEQQQQQTGKVHGVAAEAEASTLAAGLDVVASHIKVADVCTAMGEPAAATEQMANAKLILQQLCEKCQQHEGRLAARWEQLQSVLAQLMEASNSSTSSS